MAANRIADGREPQSLARAPWVMSLALTGLLHTAAASAQTQSVPAVPPASDQARQAAERRPADERRSGPFIETMPNDLLRVSKLIGIGVIGEETKVIGKVDDLVLDQRGHTIAVVVATGGFLGMGEKRFGLPFDSVLWNTADQARRVATPDVVTAGTRPAQVDSQQAAESMPGAKVGSESLNAQNVGRSGMADPATGTAEAGRRDESPATAIVAGRGGEATRAQVHLTRGDLEMAPAFRYAGEDGSSTARPRR